MTRFNLTISAEDLLDLLKKQRARYSGKLDRAVTTSNFAQAKALINKLEELELVLGVNTVPGSDAILTIDLEQAEAPTFSLRRGLY